jgi:hypothetical protein
LCTADDILFTSSLWGEWSGESDGQKVIFSFVPGREDMNYLIRATRLDVTPPNGQRSSYDCDTCKLGGAAFIELNATTEEEWNDLPHQPPAESELRVFIKVTEPEKGQLDLHLLDPYKLYDFLEWRPDQLKYEAEIVDNELHSLHITSSTSELREFLEVHRDADIFAKPLRITLTEEFEFDDPESGGAAG